MSIDLAPPATITFIVPNQMDGTFAESSPRQVLPDNVLLAIDFDQRTWRDNLSHTVIIDSKDGISKPFRLQTFDQGRRCYTPFFRLGWQNVNVTSIDAA